MRKDFDNDEALVLDAETALVLKNYKRARSLATKIFKRNVDQAKEIAFQNGCNRILLTTSALSFETLRENNHNKTYRFRIVSDSIKLQDRAAAVLLQSSYELSKAKQKPNRKNGTTTMSCEKDDVLLFLNQYDYQHQSAVMPLEVVVIFTGFCHAVGLSSCALTLIQDILGRFISMIHDTRCDDNDNEISKNVEDLLWLLLTRMLPYASHPDDVSEILNRVWKPSSRGHNVELVLSEAINEDSVAQILEGLNKWSDDKPPQTILHVIERCRSVLQPLAPKPDSLAKKKISNAPSTVNLLDQRRQRRPLLDKSQLRQWISRMYHFVVVVLRRHVSDLYVSSDDRWTNRGKAALTLFLLVVAWKKQGMIRKNTIALVAASLGPFREVLDAFTTTKR